MSVAVDSAIIKGRVVGEPQYVKNEGIVRCLFTVGLEIPIKDGSKYFAVQAIAEPDLTERCRTLLEHGDQVIAIGDFGFHKGRLKMRVKKINLPTVTGDVGIPTI